MRSPRRRLALAVALLLMLGVLLSLRAWRVDRPHGLEALLARASASAAVDRESGRAPAPGAAGREAAGSVSLRPRPSTGGMSDAPGAAAAAKPARQSHVDVRSGSLVGTWIDHEGSNLVVRPDGSFSLTLPDADADATQTRTGRYRIEDGRLRVWWDGEPESEDADTYEVIVDRDALQISSRAEGVNLSIEILLRLERLPQGAS
jgi:hypothetical protein